MHPGELKGSQTEVGGVGITALVKWKQALEESRRSQTRPQPIVRVGLCFCYTQSRNSVLTSEQDNGNSHDRCICFTIGGLRPGGPSLQLRQCAVLAQDLSSVTRTHTGRFTTAWISKCRESTVFDLASVCVQAWVYAHTHTQDFEYQTRVLYFTFKGQLH